MRFSAVKAFCKRLLKQIFMVGQGKTLLPVLRLWLPTLLVFSQLSNAQSASPPSAPPSFDSALATAQTAFDAGHWTEAEQLLRTYLDSHPHAPDALHLLATTLFHEDKPKESLGFFNDAAKLRPPSAADLHTVALDYVLLNDYDDADRWMTQSVRRSPEDGEAWYALGRIKYTENRFAESVTSFRNALRLLPRSVKAENNLGLAYEGLNQPDEAIQSYRQAITWDQANARPSEQPLLNLGILLTNRNELDEALRLLQQAEALAPGDGKIHAALGTLFSRRGDLPKAQAQLEQAVTSDPGNSGLHFQLGQVYRKQGLTERAAAELRRAATLEREARH